eukprot:20088-Heterococcus_DN1.PRE.3
MYAEYDAIATVSSTAAVRVQCCAVMQALTCRAKAELASCCSCCRAQALAEASRCQHCKPDYCSQLVRANAAYATECLGRQQLLL